MSDVTDNSTEEVVGKEEAPIDKADAVEIKETTETIESNGTKNEDAEEKSDEKKSPSNEEKPNKKDPEASIIRQVEYYFGDANLQRDKFLLDQIKKHIGGWVPLSVLMTFKRLEALSTDAEEIVNALLKSEEGLIEISEDRTKIRRHPERPIPEQNKELRQEIMTRTAYVKGFPKDSKMGELLDFFEPFEKVINLVMRNYYDKSEKVYKFKGSVFAVFANKEQAEKFVEQKDLKYKDEPLELKMQLDYIEQKNEELRAKEKKKKPEQKKKPKAEEKEIVLNKGTVLHFEGVTDDSRREDIRDVIKEIDPESTIAYIEFQQGEKKGKIRFYEEGRAAKFLEKLENNKLKLKEGMDLTLRLMEEEEESVFLNEVLNNMKNLRTSNNRKQDKGGNRKRRFGNFRSFKGKKQKVLDE